MTQRAMIKYGTAGGLRAAAALGAAKGSRAAALGAAKGSRAAAVFALMLAAALTMLYGCMLLPVEEDLLPPNLLLPEEVVYTTVPASTGTIQSVVTDQCTVASALLHNLSFGDRSGFIADMEARLNMTVEAGDVLARLDTDTLELDIQRQELAIQKIELSMDEERRTSGRSSLYYRQLEIDLEMAELTLRQMETELSKAVITAPISGIIVFTGNYKIGDFIPARSTLLTIADPQQLEFVYTGYNQQHIRHGMELEITINDTAYPAVVSMTPQTAPQEEQERYKNTVVFSPVDPQSLPDGLRIGSRHRFSILLMEKTDVIVVSREYVKNFMGQYYVQVLEDGIRVDHDLDVGIVTNTEIEVVSGISEGDLIITGTE